MLVAVRTGSAEMYISRLVLCRRADPASYNQLCRAWTSSAASPGRDPYDDRCLPDVVREQRRIRNAQSSASRTGQDRHEEPGRQSVKIWNIKTWGWG